MRRPTSLAESEEGRAFLQRRTAMYALLSLGVGGGFLAIRVFGLFTLAYLAPVRELNFIAHVVGVLAMAGVWLVNRGEAPRPARVIYWSEHVGTTIACVAYALMVSEMPQVFKPELNLLLIFALIVLTRSIMLPSTWRRTAALCALLGVLLVAVTWSVYEPLDPRFVAAFEGASFDMAGSLQTQLLTNAAMWWLGLSVLASSASAVIYGLRREMSQMKRLGQYQLVRKIGEGGMGVVYEATHAMLRRHTAVKLLLPERVGEQSLARFEREVRATAALSHPNTITVFDYGRTPDGVFYYAMEYVDGATLTDVVGIDGPMPPGRAARVVHQIAGALAEAHGAGLVHRDVKPDNVLLTRAGWMADLVKVVDFGLVKEVEGAADVGVTHENAIVGTPQYLAPETIRGRGEPDPRSDLYALGGVAYYLLTGRHVFEARTVVEMCSLHLTAAPTPPSELVEDVSPALERLVLACLAKSPEDRPASAEALQAELEALPEMTRWTRGDATRWWAQMGPDIEARRASASIGRADTLAIDLDGRATPKSFE